MGKGIVYECESCGYEKFIAIGKETDIGISTNLYVCLDCKSLVDLSDRYIGNEVHESQSNCSRLEIVSDRLGGDNTLKSIKSLPKEDQEFLARVFGIGICEHRRAEAWDDVKRPCPRCGGKMEDSYKLGFAILD